MKYLSSIIVLMVSMSVNVICQGKNNKAGEELPKKNTINNCLANSDSLYNRQDMLEKLATILNDTSTHYHNAKYQIKKKLDLANVKNERPFGFFVYDLTDDSNGTSLSKCIEFKNNHIYHFALMDIPYSFNHIVILEGGTLKVFKAINCKDGDSLENAISYLNQKLKDDKDKDEILNRVRNYRKYGIYSTVDDDFLRCQ